MCVCGGGGGGGGERDNIQLYNCIHFLRHKVLLCSPAQLKVATGAPSKLAVSTKYFPQEAFPRLSCQTKQESRNNFFFHCLA